MLSSDEIVRRRLAWEGDSGRPAQSVWISPATAAKLIRNFGVKSGFVFPGPASQVPVAIAGLDWYESPDVDDNSCRFE